MAKTSIYKLYIGYIHTIDGKMGRTVEFPANTDAYACGVGSSEFSKDENSNIGILVKKDGRDDVIVCTYEHQVF